MGYTKEFKGVFKFNHPPSEYMIKYINSFSKSRRMKRDVELIKSNDPDWEKYSFKGNLGIEGEYYIKDNEYFFDNKDPSIINFNIPPKTQPGLWCQWIINENGDLCWDGVEKFYNYIEWLRYLIDNFFVKENLILNGKVEFQGEYDDDKGTIEIEDNKIKLIRYY